jgi:class 3 adenylate cyclase/S1-C subfamily serine protease
MDRGTPSSPEDRTPAPRRGEERRTVTTLFCDLVGFTALSERNDAELVDAFLRRYYSAARRVIESYGGTVEKFIGDAVVAAFGVPVLHEDDPERAVRAGLRLIDEVDALPGIGGQAVEVRVGVNTGEALVRLDVDPSSGEGFLTGDAVNVAARLQSAAPPMAVAVGAATHAATEKVFAFDSCHPVALKGKSKPLQAWIATAPLARTGSELRTFSSAFVGREEELAALEELLAEAVENRTPRFALVVGAPGIGKSRLLAELARRLDDQPTLVTWCQGRCLPFGAGVTFWALSEIVRAAAGILESDGVARAEARLETVLPEGEDRERLRARLRPLLGLEAEEASREENFFAWRELLEGQAACGPAVLVVEDLHWADEAMLAFMDYLSESSAGVPLLVLATARPEVLELAGPGAGFVAAATRLPLGPLSGEETAELARARLGAKSLPTDLQALILERSGGNPLFAEELMRLLEDRGLLDSRGGKVALKEGAEVPMPDSIGALIAARLDLLTPERKALLSDAAVVGRTFWAGAVAAVSGREPAEVLEGLMELVAKELVSPVRGSSMEGETEFLFVHALVCDVAYAQLTRADRAAKHAALARWLEGRTAGRTEDLAEVLAYHYGTALEMANSCGLFELEDELAEPTTRYLALAGGRAAPLDSAAAAAHFARAERVADEAAKPKRRFFLSRRARRTLKRRAPLLAAAAAVIAVAVVAALAVYEFRPQPKPSGPTTLTSVQVADKYMPSVVDITAKVPTVVHHTLHWHKVTVPGVVASKNAKTGLVFTSGASLRNASLGWYARTVTVGVWNSAGQYQTVPGGRLDNDLSPDVAVIEIDPHKVGLVPIPPSDTASVWEGAQVVSLGRGGPTGNVPWLASGTVTSLSSDSSGGRPTIYALQTAIASSELRAGCPLIDMTGHLLGVMGVVQTDSGTVAPGFGGSEAAMGVGYFQQCAADYGRQAATMPAPFLGVRVRTVTPRLAAVLGLTPTGGALVEFVVPDSPAAKAGIKGGTRVVRVGHVLSTEWEHLMLAGMKSAHWTASDVQRHFRPGVCIVGGDIIVGLDGRPITSGSDLAYGLCSHKPGQVVTIHLVRDGKPLSIKATLVPDLLWDWNWQ